MYAGTPYSYYTSNTGNLPGDATMGQYDEIYILSLPAFTWVKAKYPPSLTRSYHTCHIVGRQLISLFGLDPRTRSSPGARDQFTNGIGVFDINQLEWSDKYDPNAGDYKTPGLVADYYYNTATGPANWSSPALKSLFDSSSSIKYTGPISGRTNTSNAPAPGGTVVGGAGGSSSTSPSNSTSKPVTTNKLSVGAIVGFAILGAAVFLGAIAAAVFVILRKRRRGRIVEIANVHEHRMITTQPSSFAEGGWQPQEKLPTYEMRGQRQSSEWELEGERPASPQELAAHVPETRPAQEMVQVGQSSTGNGNTKK
jgi:hypothetical protein